MHMPGKGGSNDGRRLIGHTRPNNSAQKKEGRRRGGKKGDTGEKGAARWNPLTQITTGNKGNHTKKGAGAERRKKGTRKVMTRGEMVRPGGLVDFVRLYVVYGGWYFRFAPLVITPDCGLG